MHYVIIIRIIDNNSVINSSYVRLQYLILPFTVCLGTRKNFLEIYRQFGEAPSKSFTCPALGSQAKLRSLFHPSKPEIYLNIIPENICPRENTLIYITETNRTMLVREIIEFYGSNQNNFLNVLSG
jgi:hypothetical protein